MIEKKPRHRTTMLRFFLIEARSKMAQRLTAKCPSYFLSSPKENLLGLPLEYQIKVMNILTIEYQVNA
jgi:hypothetical protein